jgi:hypothetical protein
MDDSVFQLVKSVVEELAEELGYDNLRHVTADTPLFGGDSGVDSLSKQLILADERAMSRRHSPFRTIGTLCELVQEQVAATHA